MSQSLKIITQKSADGVVLKLQGQIDEDADYSGADYKGSQKVIFDFEGVPLVNSTGLQKWMGFLKTLPKDVKIYFDRCTPKIVKQIDMFAGFMGDRDVVIRSFFAPYYCTECDKPQHVLLESKDVKGKKQAPESRCKECKKIMEFDGLEKKYFLFLEKSK